MTKFLKIQRWEGYLLDKEIVKRNFYK